MFLCIVYVCDFNSLDTYTSLLFFSISRKFMTTKKITKLRTFNFSIATEPTQRELHFSRLNVDSVSIVFVAQHTFFCLKIVVNRIVVFIHTSCQSKWLGYDSFLYVYNKNAVYYCACVVLCALYSNRSSGIFSRV